MVVLFLLGPKVSTKFRAVCSINNGFISDISTFSVVALFLFNPYVQSFILHLGTNVSETFVSLLKIV